MKRSRMGLVLSLCCSETSAHQLDSRTRKRTHSRYLSRRDFTWGSWCFKKITGSIEGTGRRLGLWKKIPEQYPTDHREVTEGHPLCGHLRTIMKLTPATITGLALDVLGKTKKKK